MHRAWLLMLLFVPAAQALEVTAPPPEGYGDIAPGTTVTGSIDVTIECDETFDAATPPTGLVYDSEADEGLSVQHQQYYPLPPGLCITEDKATIHTTHNVSTTMDTQGERHLDIEHDFQVVDQEGLPLGGGDMVKTQALVSWWGRIETSVPSRSQEEGPQKQIAYEIEIWYTGNAMGRVQFELVEPYPARGQVILPDQVVLEPGMVATREVLYSTPFENGDVEANETFTIRAIPMSNFYAENVGEPVEETFNAVTDGVYVPGPGIGILLAGLVALARRH